MAFLRHLQTLDSLKIYGFRVLFLGMLGQWAAWNLQMITQSLLLYRLTGSAAILGTMALVNAIPQLVLSLFAGVMADRFNKKYIILITQGVAVFSMVAVAVSLSTGYLSPQHSGSWWVLIAAGFIQSVAMALMMPARQAIILELVGRERLMNAAAISSVGMSIFQVVIPVVGGVLIDAIDFTAIYYIMSGLSLTAIIFTSFLPANRATGSINHQNVFANIGDGLKYAWHNSVILFVIWFSLVSMILTSPQMSMMAIYADSILKVGATGMGVLQSISGISGLVISLVMASLPSRKRGLMLMVTSLVSGLALLVFAFSRSMILSSAIMVITGFTNTINMLATTTLMQAYSEEEYLGRVLSIQMIGMGLSGLGSFITGIMTEYVGIEWSIGSFAIVLALVSLLVLMAMPKMRKVD